MELAIIIMLIIGFILIGVSIFLIKKEDKERAELNTKIDEVFNAINSSLEMIENNSAEFNNLCEIIFKETEEKYQELLLLYSLIDEQKSKDTEKTKSADKNQKSDIQKSNAPKEQDNSFIYKNKNSKEIFRLYDSGVNISEIAKRLSIGKGEVQLILNIRKA